jgi:hypothetical protein
VRLNPVVRVGGDAGGPSVIAEPESLVARRFGAIAGKMAARLAVKSMQALPILA